MYTEPQVAVIEFSNRVMVKLELLPGTRVLLLPLVSSVFWLFLQANLILILIDPV